MKPAIEYLTIIEAAAVLHMTPKALRKRCTCHARARGKEVFAELGDGIVAVKLGKTWRIKIPALAAVA